MKPNRTPTHSPRPRILVADDDGLVLATLCAGLRDEGYEVLEAGTGEEAVEICEREQPDLAILDIRMPGLSGIEAARQIFAAAHVPFLFLSAFDDSETVESAVSEGALGYLVKPIDTRQMVPAIEAALTRAAEIRDLQDKEVNLSAALASGREVSIAVGLVAGNTGLTAQQAEDALRAYARSQRRRMADIASELIAASERLNKLYQAIEGAAAQRRNHNNNHK